MLNYCYQIVIICAIRQSCAVTLIGSRHHENHALTLGCLVQSLLSLPSQSTSLNRATDRFDSVIPTTGLQTKGKDVTKTQATTEPCTACNGKVHTVTIIDDCEQCKTAWGAHVKHFSSGMDSRGCRTHCTCDLCF